ncbi:hypothetical protein BJX61DRAFT_552364 [Aspergillus egyptiacus]|nr:hypothetical protein BJX61DRAFT_552364 [Aspergillus egyptiacus]
MNASDIERYRKRIIQYLWDPEPKNDEEPDSPIWCLGTAYPPPEPRARVSEEPSKFKGALSGIQIYPKQDMALTSQANDDGRLLTTSSTSPLDWPEQFLLDFESRLWMTYRSNFSPIAKDAAQEADSSLALSVRLRSQLLDSQGFTSDTGWGCMIRSGQSLLANAMVIMSLGRNWRRGDGLRDEVRILALFADSPKAPFSIHNFVRYGAEFCGKHPGEWFGPAATARCIQGLSAKYTHSSLRVYTTDDSSDVYEDRFMGVARDEQSIVRPTLILLGLRLGIDRVTAVYWEGLKAVLQYPQSVGIAGGRPSASHYFIGVQGSHFFYLDPHSTRPALRYCKPGESYTEDEVNTCHTRRLRRLHIRDMDPSMLIGFLINDEEDWKDWKARVAHLQGKHVINIIENSDNALWQGRKEALDEVEAFDE